MKLRILSLAWLALSVAACARPPGPPPVLPSRVVAVLPANNQTGDPLLVAGSSVLERYALRTDRVTVPDVLESEARLQLLRRGFTVTDPETVHTATTGRIPSNTGEAAKIGARAGLDGNVLYIDLRRWEVDVPVHPSAVIVSVQVSLIDPASGRVLWSADHPSRPIATPGVVNLGDAYTIAARKVMEELLAPLGGGPHPT